MIDSLDTIIAIAIEEDFGAAEPNVYHDIDCSVGQSATHGGDERLREGFAEEGE